ncbi:Cellulose synthase 1 [Phlyctema vagabunda]|uniref:Cellulose synthase 1 n=1 Tax=Phlyctema vagabunda TaxID=108571 RepID=A0ABR4P3S0_9HELO
MVLVMAQSKPAKINHGPYEIRRSPPEPVAVETHPYIFATSNLVTWTLWFIYFLTQFSIVYKLHSTSSSTWKIWGILLGEICLTFQEIVLGMNLLLPLLCQKKNRIRQRYYLFGDTAPTVDIFITCCGEPIDVILDTVSAALSQNYPHEQLRLFLLDDGHDNKLKVEIDKLNKIVDTKSSPAIHYLARQVEQGSKSYFKAGNLQFGIKETKRLGGSDLIASLDADMIPSRDWLRRLVPHLILDGELALACPPQCYYNIPDYDPLGQQAEFDVFFSVYEPLNDLVDAATCTGTGYVIRRSALEDIGGWPIVEAGEDFMCSTILSNNGWKVGFVRENLQFGLAPDSLRSYKKQRMRWTVALKFINSSVSIYLAQD